MAQLQLLASDRTVVVIDYALPEAEPEAGASFDFTLPPTSGRPSSTPCRAFLDSTGFVGHRDVVRVMGLASYREGEGGPPLVPLHPGDAEWAVAQAHGICVEVADALHGRGAPGVAPRKVLVLLADLKQKFDHAETDRNALLRLGSVQDAGKLALQLAVALAKWNPDDAEKSRHLRAAEHLALLSYDKPRPTLPTLVLTNVVSHLLEQAIADVTEAHHGR